MDLQTAKKIMHILETAQRDPHYQHLYREYEAVNGKLLAQMDTMSDAQRSAVLDYIGLCAEIHMTQLVLALHMGRSVDCRDGS